MDVRHILQEIRHNMKTVVARDSELGLSLWHVLLNIHPADIANFFADNTKIWSRINTKQWPLSKVLPILKINQIGNFHSENLNNLKYKFIL